MHKKRHNKYKPIIVSQAHRNCYIRCCTYTVVQSRLVPCYHIGGEAEDERADEDANLFSGTLPPLLLLSETPLLHTDRQTDRHRD